MSNLTLLLVLLGLTSLVYQFGLWRSQRWMRTQPTTKLHSRPIYHASLLAFWCLAPALLLLVFWFWLEPKAIQHLLFSALPSEVSLDNNARHHLLARLQAILAEQVPYDQQLEYEISSAAYLARIQSYSQLSKTLLIALAIAATCGLVLSKQSAQFKARHHIERIVRYGLWGCSTLAILTTLGIVFSMLGEALRFFSFVEPLDFFFGTRWNPVFSSTDAHLGEYGLLPLLWGTLMITLIAMLVAVPVGLMCAIYLSEYASPWFRNCTKPVIEILAGIPTIVYGVFAMLAVGPFFAWLGDVLGWQIRATSALTAGVVMGIMIVPFVSSLADDIIRQVPNALREGSLGLGATSAETIIHVVLPAALPGIMGAFLLAVSRAIGETMIVVLAAGNNPKLHANPFEAISTVTVSIINQLTGDTDFAGPQSLVAFALGLTLFVITLLLNIVALYIVRKYREQYD